MTCMCSMRRILISLAIALLAAGAGSSIRIARVFAQGTPLRTSCATALTLERAGSFDLARRSYLAIISRGNPPRCAVTGFDRLTTRGSRCALARSLQRLGRRTDVEAAYMAELRRDPRSRCAQEGLKNLKPAGRSISKRVSDAAATATHALLLVLVGIALVSVLLVLLLAGLARIKFLNSALRRMPITRTLLAPRLKVEDFEDGASTVRMGPGVAALIRAGVTDRIHGIKHQLGLVSGQSEFSGALANLQDLSPQLRVALAVITVLDALLPRQRFTVAGVLQPPGGQGVGLSLTLRRGSSFAAMQSFWAVPLGCVARASANGQPVPDDAPAAYHRLSGAACAWVDHQLATALGAKSSITGDSFSFALFRAGVDWQEDGDMFRARRLYDLALKRDPRNTGALANLGQLAASHGYYDVAITRLELARNALEQRTA
jgi:tetratricopeptide (TPR) repeat protein